MFVFYMSTHRQSNGLPIVSSTIDGYVSHVIFHLIEHGIIDCTADFRCPSSQRLLRALTLQDAIRLGPLRLRINIAVSLPIIDACRIQALTSFPCPVTRMFITAALYVGFALSLRPGDYLYPLSTSHHRVRPLQLEWWFPSGHVNLFDVANYPPVGTRPLRLSFLPDYDKANPLGGLVMRACACNPDPHEFCFIQFLFEFFRKFPTVSNESSLFGALPSHIDLYACVNSLFKVTAPTLGLSPHQLVPRGLRAAATAHIRDAGGSEADAKLTGGWRSDAHNAYKRANFAASDRCALAMHNAVPDSLPLTHYVHSSAAPSLL
jgi:hypothetical protein